MSFCSFAGGNSIYGITPLENMFIIEYMPSAPAEFVKVYLFMLMLCAFPGECDTIPEVAAALRTDENTVINALRHWEREGLMQKMSDNPPTYSFVPIMQKGPRQSTPGDSMYQNRDFNREFQGLMPGVIIDSHELRQINDWQDVFGLTQDAILYMAECEINKYNGKSLPGVHTIFKHLNSTAEEWAENGVKDIEAAKNFMALKSEFSKTASAVVDQLGQRRSPTRDEIILTTKWMTDWKLTQDEIIAACAETVKSSNPSFAYLDKILESRINGAPDNDVRSNVKTICMHLGILSRPTPAQIEAYNSFLGMGFEFGAVEQAARWCGENNRHTFDDVKRKLEQWKKAGAFTVADIEQERSKQQHYVDMLMQIFEKAGIDSKPGASDVKFVSLWTALLSLDTVLVAASLAMGAQSPMKYIDKLIRTWSASGINTPEKAMQEAEKYRARQTASQPEKKMITRETVEDESDQDFYSELMNRKRDAAGGNNR